MAFVNPNDWQSLVAFLVELLSSSERKLAPMLCENPVRKNVQSGAPRSEVC
jgi:hypothetical protein